MSAANEVSNAPKLIVSTAGSPTIAARRNTPRNDSSVARHHTIVCSRFTGTPRPRARFDRSALARMAVPASV